MRSLLAKVRIWGSSSSRGMPDPWAQVRAQADHPELTSEQSSWGVMAPTLLSSMTVFRDSIHMGSMSPSRMIHLGPLCVMLARSRMAVENRPAPQRHSGLSLAALAAQGRFAEGRAGLALPRNAFLTPHGPVKSPKERSSHSTTTAQSVYSLIFYEGICPRGSCCCRTACSRSHPHAYQRLTVLPLPCGWMNNPEQLIAGHGLWVEVHSDRPPLHHLVRPVERLQHLRRWDRCSPCPQRGRGAARGLRVFWAGAGGDPVSSGTVWPLPGTCRSRCCQ